MHDHEYPPTLATPPEQALLESTQKDSVSTDTQALEQRLAQLSIEDTRQVLSCAYPLSQKIVAQIIAYAAAAAAAPVRLDPLSARRCFCF